MIEDVRDRVIVKFPISGYHGHNGTRNIRSDIVKDGWDGSGYVKSAVQLLKNHMLHRALLQNPFGRLSGENFQFDQYLEALDVPRLDKVTHSFVDAWNDYLAVGTSGSNIEVIGVVGSPRNDQDSYEVTRDEGLPAFYERADKALSPLTKTGMSIELDNSTAGDKNGFTYQLAQRLRNAGHKVYVEAIPQMGHDWWLDYPTLTRESLLQKREHNPDLHYYSPEDLKSELIRYPKPNHLWVRLHPSAWPSVMCKIIAQGDTLLVEDFMLRHPYENRTIQGLADCANKMAAAHSN